MCKNDNGHHFKCWKSEKMFSFYGEKWNLRLGGTFFNKYTPYPNMNLKAHIFNILQYCFSQLNCYLVNDDGSSDDAVNTGWVKSDLSIKDDDGSCTTGDN